MATEDQITIPVYDHIKYKCIRMKDIKGYSRLELEQWLREENKWQPMFFVKGEGTVNDAVFVEDYLGFLDYLAGKKLLSKNP